MENERNLLFGELALQTGLIEAAQLEEARTGTAALPEFLVERGWLTPEDRLHLEYLVIRKLERQAGGLVSEGAFGDLTPPPPRDGPGFAATAVPARPAGSPAAPSQPGRYSLDHLHATGGIGRVWLTRDATLGRQVALKELRPDTAGHPALRARFLEEARITGQLEHPGIVPVYELAWRGEPPQPFYTMRFVKGRTLTQAVRDYHHKRKGGKAGPLDLHALLNVFGTICNTLAYAHARGVIHRDLKGQNVLLGDFGEVIVLDWGLAKLLDQKEAATDLLVVALEADADRDATLQGQVLGTPAYMAPEQAAGELDRIDARTDVYGLGAILYEILTGQPPFTGTDTNDLLRKIQEEAPPRPGQLAPGVPRALEAVCLKALARVPEARYAAAAELAGDIRRWLADEPVSACREPWGTRLGRWARRHKPLVSGAGALLCTAVVALTLSTVLIGRQKARAEENFQMARDAVEQFFVRVSEEQLLQEPGLQPLRQSLLETAREFFQRFVDENAGDPARQIDLGTTLVKLARLTGEIGDPAQALDLLRRAELILAAVVRQRPEDLVVQHELAACRNGLGVRYRDLGRLQEAEQAFRQAVETARPPAEAETPEYRHTLGRCYNSLGLVCRELGRRDQAEEFLRAAIGVQEKLVEEHPADLRYRNDLGGSFNNLASLLSSQNKPAEAAVELYRALDLWGGQAEGGPPADRQENRATGHSNLAGLYAAHHLPLQAWDHAQLAVHLYERLAEASPAVTRYRHKLARAQLKLGNIFEQFWERARPAEKATHLAEARRSYAEAQRLLERLARDYPHVAPFTLDRASVCVSLGNLSGYAKELPAALEWYQRALTHLDGAPAEIAGSADARRPRMLALWGRADALAQLNRHAEALPLWDQAIPLAEGRPLLLLRLGRLTSLTRLGEHARVAEAVRRVAAAHPDQPGILFDLARALALAAAAVARDERTKSAEREELSQRYADGAVELLQRALKAGVFKNPANREQLRTDKDLDVLRTREDFRRLLHVIGVEP